MLDARCLPRLGRGAGDLIDNTIGVSFGFAALTSAAFGQIFSDVSGICFGGVVETAANRLGLGESGITANQEKLRGEQPNPVTRGGAVR